MGTHQPTDGTGSGKASKSFSFKLSHPRKP